MATELRTLSGPVDLGGATVSTWTYSGVLPGPAIRAAAGDRLAVRVRNQLDEPTTVHWHGIALRNDMDGVPGLTQAPIAPAAEFTYSFTAPDPGTYLFHSHVGTQLDRGLSGPLIIEDPAEPGRYDHELVVLVDDWVDGTGRTPDQVLTDLRAHGMTGMAGMGGMAMPQAASLGGDAGDVTYPHFLANGRRDTAARSFRARPGDRVRLRLINAGADTAFRIGVPGVAMTVTHTDGFPVAAVSADAVLLGMGERIDALIRMPDAAVPLLGIAEGKGGAAHVLLQPGNGRFDDVSGAVAALAARPVVLVDARLAPTDAVALPVRAPDVIHDLVLAGPGPRYQWTINGAAYDPDLGLPVRTGERVRLRMRNDSTMYHPMHVHGHTFQIVGPAGPGPRKDTVLVLPGRTVEADLDADNPGQWLAHCHNAYHGEAGMMTVLSYRG